MPVILTFFDSIDLSTTLGAQRTSKQTDNDVNFSRSCDQGKITKSIRRYMGVKL